jgi:hypothetical protein
MFRKTFAAFSVLVVALLAYAPHAYSWSWATHAYIDERIGSERGLNNLDRIYGGIAPDLFIYLFEYPEYRTYLTDQTHVGFAAVTDEARSARAKAFACGFASHNDAWGIDYTAHHSGITFGRGEGYVITKAGMLSGILDGVPEFSALGLPEEMKMEIAHEIVENGVDILVKRLDPLVGQRILASATRRSPEFPRLLATAYAPDFSEYAGIDSADAANFITAVESDFRRSLIAYGYLLTQDEDTAVALFSEEMASMAVIYLAANGITPPEGVDLVPLLEFAIRQAMELCEGDYAEEIEATADHVAHELQATGLCY